MFDTPVINVLAPLWAGLVYGRCTTLGVPPISIVFVRYNNNNSNIVIRVLTHYIIYSWLVYKFTSYMWSWGNVHC